MVLAKGHNARWPLTSLHSSKSWTHSRLRRSTTASARPPRPSTRPSSRPSSPRVIGAGPHQRTPERLAQRNGHRPRLLATTAGDLELRIPKLRAGSFFPSLLERRRRVDQALFAVVMEAYLHGVSTRKVDDLVRALGADSGISKSEVSRICADLDERGRRVPGPLAGRPAPTPMCSWMPPTARPGSTAGWSPRRWWSPPASAATAAARSSASPSATPRTARSGPRSCARLKARGLAGVQLVIADAHLGLEGRDRLGVARRGLATLPGPLHAQRARPGAQGQPAEMVAAAIRTIFAQPDAEHVHEQFDVIAGMLGTPAPQGRGDAPRRPRRPAGLHRRSRSATGRRSGRPTRSSGSTRKSSAAPTSSASSPTPPRCSAWPARSWSRPTTNGRSPPTAATSPNAPWPCSPPSQPRRWPSPNS